MGVEERDDSQGAQRVNHPGTPRNIWALGGEGLWQVPLCRKTTPQGYRDKLVLSDHAGDPAAQAPTPGAARPDLGHEARAQ